MIRSSFPVDDLTLDWLVAAMYPDPAVTETSSLAAFLAFVSELAGADTQALAEVTEAGTEVARDADYGIHEMVLALIQEIRRLRNGVAS